jgi:nucleoside 2-deoxyribosyltransferase
VSTIYFAGPLFTQAERHWNNRIVTALRGLGHTVIAPQELTCALPMIFDANVAGLHKCDVVVAVLEGADVDSGTAWECGYARHAGKVVIGIRTDFRAGGDDPKAPVNLMISYGCDHIITVPFSQRDDTERLIARLDKALRPLDEAPTRP